MMSTWAACEPETGTHYLQKQSISFQIKECLFLYWIQYNLIIISVALTTRVLGLPFQSCPLFQPCALLLWSDQSQDCKYIYKLRTFQFVSLDQTSPLNFGPIYNCLLDISLWLFSRHLRFNTKNKVLIMPSHHKTLPYLPVFFILWNFIFPVNQARN